jgi:hypothetical protein
VGLQVVADLYEQGDLVLVLDYELMLLPMLLRKRFPDIICGFFLHCPFPSSEFYRMLPVRQVLLQVRTQSLHDNHPCPHHCPISPPQGVLYTVEPSPTRPCGHARFERGHEAAQS